MSNSCKFSDLLLINCAIEPYLSWSKECIISEILITPTVAGNQNQNPSAQAMAAIKTAGAKFRINSAKRYVPVVTLSLNDNIKFLENIKQRFERIISCNKCRSEITTQTKQ